MSARNQTFDVRYTESGRLVPVDDPLMLRISEQLESSQRTVSDLMSTLDVASSTLYMTINKMCESGLIAKCPNEGRRNAKYMSSSMSIMRSCDTMDMPSFDWMVNKSHRESDSFLAMLDMFHRMGLDLNPIMRSFGRRLALTENSRRMCADVTSEGLVREFGEYLVKNDLGNVELKSFAPFVIRISPGSQIEDIYRPVAYIIVGFLKQMFMTITGRDIVVTSIDHDADGSWYVHYGFGNGSSRSLDVRTMHPELDTDRFLLAKPKIRGMVRLITNPSEVRIMEAVNSCPVRMSDVAKIIRSTKSTASMYINKLIRDGFLESENRNGTIYIGSLYAVILSRDSSVSGRVEDLMDIMGKVTDFDSMVHNMMRFFSGSLRYLGFDTHYIMEELGSVVAEQKSAAVCENDVLSMLNRYVSRLREQNSDINITSLTPLTVLHRVPSKSSVRENMAYYHNGYLKRMMELAAGREVLSRHRVYDNGDVLTITYTFESGEAPEGDA